MFPILYKLPDSEIFINLAHLIVVRWNGEYNTLSFDLIDSQFYTLRCADKAEADKIMADIAGYIHMEKLQYKG